MGVVAGEMVESITVEPKTHRDDEADLVAPGMDNDPEPAAGHMWRLYKKTKDATLREKLVVRYAPLVKQIAVRMAAHLPNTVDVDDLVSYGVLGLLDAIEKFDIDQNVKFATYAKRRIHGAILDGLRELDWAPRVIRQRARERERILHELEASLGRGPSDEELAGRLGVSRRELQQLDHDTKKSVVLSLDEGESESPGGGSRRDLIPDVDGMQPEDNAERNELIRILADEVQKLPERERLVVTLYYYEDFTSKEIARILGVTDSRVSQIHSRAKEKLHNRLRKYRESL